MVPGCVTGVSLPWYPGGVYTQVYLPLMLPGWYMQGIPLSCYPGGVCRVYLLPSCYPGGVCRVCTSLLWPPGPCRVCTPPYYASLYHPGYTTVPHTTGYTAAPRLACRLTHSWALSGRNPWVGASQRPKVNKGVRGEGALCARLLRFSRRIK